jgi:hypothetical protein
MTQEAPIASTRGRRRHVIATRQTTRRTGRGSFFRAADTATQERAMNIALNHRGSLTTPSTTRTTAARAPGRSRAADYVADVCLVALLAAPFMLFEAPSTLPDAVIASRAGPVVASQPAPARAEHAAATDRR